MVPELRDLDGNMRFINRRDMKSEMSETETERQVNESPGLDRPRHVLGLALPIRCLLVPICPSATRINYQQI